MNRVKVYTALGLNSFALLLAAAMPPQAHAITLNMTYFNEGDPVPHDENPNWDPAGVILKAHFQAAKTIWESLLPGGGSYDFDFEWDNDISGLGLTTDTVGDTFIEINPNANWYADPFPNDNAEFSAGTTQTLFSALSASDQSTYFPGTAPPGALETRYNLVGSAGIPGAGGFDAQNGTDLLDVILHEIGHVLGIAGTEPGEYNIYPQHVGGLSNVLVLEDDDSGHLAGNNITPGFLMCEACEPTGVRRLPTATDVLVIAEDQSITDVRLARVGRISSGMWSDANAWIGGAVPAYQDVYISHGGTVTLDAYAVVRSLTIFSGANSLQAQSYFFNVDGPLTFTGATVSVGSGGTIMAASIVGDPAALTTTAGSTVAFNQWTAPPSTTSVTFNGSVAIGIDPGFQDAIRPSVTFNRGSISTWNVAERLTIGDAGAIATVSFNNGAHVTSGTGQIGSDVLFGEGHVVIDGLGSSWTTSGVFEARNGTLDLKNAATMTTGAASLGSVVGQMQVTVNYAFWEVNGDLDIGAPTYIGPVGGALAVQDAAQVHVDGNITIHGTPSFTSAAVVESNAFLVADGDIFVKSYGVLRYRNDREAREKIENEGAAINAGIGGITYFQDTSNAIQSEIHNRGTAFANGTGGRTNFLNSSSAENAAIHNHGATHVNGGGGVTQFRNSSTADSANIFNHADGTYYVFDTLGATSFFDSSNAGTATIENEGASSQSKMPGRTEFRNSSSAASATINNRGYITIGYLAGRTMFYDQSSAGNATLRTFDGYSDHGRIEFYNQSTAASAHISIENEPLNSASAGGYLNFYDTSTAAQSEITVRAGTNGTVYFRNSATAGNAQITTETGAGNAGNITFWESSTAGNANIALGEGGVMTFYSQSTAANATISLANRAQISFSGGSAGQAQIVAAGGSTYTAGAQAAIYVIGSSTAANSTITVNGASAPLASPATIQITGGGSAGNATLIANGGTNGGAGGVILFNGAANGSTARVVANAGALVDFFNQQFYNDISLGSIEGAGKFALAGAHLIVGSRNTNTSVTGQIVDNPPGSATGGRITKVGAGTLTLAATNTYSGLTTVNAGTLSVTGSLTGGAVVNSSGTLNGTGTIGGTVTVNSDGVLAPGTSAGVLHAASATLMSGAMFTIELGGATAGSQYDQLLVSGALSLNGALNVSLINGFTPSAGQSFNILDWGSLAGTFSSLNLPTLTGATWNTSQLYVTGVLSVALPGDFNYDGKVDAADYIVWRKTDSTPEGFNAWRANFGRIGAGSGSGAGMNAAVPEPATRLMLVLATAGVSTRRGWCVRRVPKLTNA